MSFCSTIRLFLIRFTIYWFRSKKTRLCLLYSYVHCLCTLESKLRFGRFSVSCEMIRVQEQICIVRLIFDFFNQLTVDHFKIVSNRCDVSLVFISHNNTVVIFDESHSYTNFRIFLSSAIDSICISGSYLNA